MNINSARIIIRAAYFAGEKHRNQRRGDIEETPYINHPLELASILVEEGQIDDVDVICAALLHDTIEDTNTSYDELVNQFGKSIAKIVLEVSNDMSLDPALRKSRELESIQSLSNAAKLVKLADKIANIRDVSTMPPVGWSLDRKKAYFDFALKIVDQAKDVSPLLYKIFLKDYRCLNIGEI